MQIPQPVQTTLDALSPRARRLGMRAAEVGRYLKQASEVERIYAAILTPEKKDRLRDIARRYQSDEIFHGSKYRHYIWYLRENISRALDLGLGRSRPLRVLDLGCGPGYFLAVCDALGHQSIGVDLPGSEFFSELRSALAVTTHSHRIVSNDIDGQDSTYDLITAFSITFNQSDAGHWSRSDWAVFLRTLSPKLSSSGRAILRFNCASAQQLGGPAELLAAASDPTCTVTAASLDLRTVELRPRPPGAA